MQNYFTQLKEAIEKVKKTKTNYDVELNSILSNDDTSENVKKRQRTDLESNSERSITEAISLFNKTIEQLRSQLHERESDWKYADSPKLSSVLTLIQMGVQPTETMIKEFKGDIVSMSVLSAALNKSKLYDSTGAYRLTEGIDNIIDNISLNFEFSVRGMNGYSLNAAEKGLVKIANAMGCEFGRDSIDAFASAAMKGGGLIV